MAEVIYTPTEKLLLNYVSNIEEIPSYELEGLAKQLDRGSEIWLAVELGRCPSTDRRTYILHTYYDKPKHDYYGAEKISLEIIKD